MSVAITLSDLERCVQLLLGVARSRGIDIIELGDRDYYWTVPTPEWLEMTKQPEPAVGSLCDDLLELNKLLNEPERAGSVDLERVAALLRVLSDELSS